MSPRREAHLRRPPGSRAPRALRPALLACLALSIGALLVLAPAAGAASGDLAWQRAYDSPGHVNDSFGSVVPAPNGGVYVAGQTESNASDFLVARYDASGQRRWLRTYNGPGNSYDGVLAAATDGSGDLVVVGMANGENVAVAKYSAAGHRRWVRIYDDPQGTFEEADAVAVDPAGNIYAAGYRVSAATGTDIVLLKYSPAGAPRWVRRFTGSGVNLDSPSDIATDAHGNVYVSGTSFGVGTGNDIVTLKYDGAGHRRWVERWDGPASGDDAGNAIAVTAAGTVYVTGSAPGISSDLDAVTLKYAANGALRWHRTYTSAGASSDHYADIALLGNGDVVAAGSSPDSASQNYDVLLVRLSPSGTTRWARLYDGGSNDDSHNVARGPSGAIYVVGNSYSTTTNWDTLTVKYGAAGDFRWARRYAGAGAFDQQTPDALAVHGGVYVAGVQEGVSNDAMLVKYKP